MRVLAIAAMVTVAGTPTAVLAQSLPRIESVVNVTSPGADPIPTAVLGDVLTVRVKNLNTWCDANAQTKLYLFLAGAELKNVVAAPTSIDAAAPADIGALRMTLEVEGADVTIRKAWVQVLQAAKRGDPVEVSVGASGQAPFGSDARVRIDVYPTRMTYGVLVFYVILAFWIVRLGRRSFMLRDSNGAPNPPYSLARHQMAIWFIVVVGAYLYIWLTTGLFAGISTTALTLIGISGATGLVAVTMDATKWTDAVNARSVLQAERDAINVLLNAPATGVYAQLLAAAPGSAATIEVAAAVTPKQTRLNELNALLQAPVAPPHNSDGWIKDLVSNDEGVSFHRVQMVVWTLVLVVVFVFAVKANVLMPLFDNTLLGLMGISSATYLGFKFPEKAA